MNQNELQKKIESLCNDSRFTAELSACSTAAEMAALFTREGVEMTAEEMEQVIAMASVPVGEELDENALDAVSGGARFLGRAGLILLPLLPRLPSILPIRPIIKRR